MKRLADIDWVAQLSGSEADSQAALEELRHVLTQRVGRAFRSNPTVNEAFVEDVVQDALIAILNSLDTFQGKSQFLTWATTISVRVAIAELRRLRWKDVSLDGLLESSKQAEAVDDSFSHPASQYQTSQLMDAMHERIANDLTEKQRIALQAELEGMPLQEIARRMGTNRNAIYKLLHDARKRLKRSLIEAGYSAEDLQSIGRTAS